MFFVLIDDSVECYLLVILRLLNDTTDQTENSTENLKSLLPASNLLCSHLTYESVTMVKLVLFFVVYLTTSMVTIDSLQLFGNEVDFRHVVGPKAKELPSWLFHGDRKRPMIDFVRRRRSIPFEALLGHPLKRTKRMPAWLQRVGFKPVEKNRYRYILS